MREFNALAVWVGAVLFVTAGLLLLFYAAALLLPIILAVIAFSIVANWIRRVYKSSHGGEENIKVFYKKSRGENPSQAQKSSPKIIDAEYEIIDDDK